MQKEKAIPVKQLQQYPQLNEVSINLKLSQALQEFKRKIVVLDDDPTGTQTVHGLSVYTDWSEDSFLQGFAEDPSMFFILTNSRSFTASETVEVHKSLVKNLAEAAGKSGQDFILVSRGDSTLRGHYPLEMEILREQLAVSCNRKYDGEILIPFFEEGGRFTLDNIHYVQEGDTLIPAGQTEFAKDKTFPYQHSHLGEYVEEKTQGSYPASACIYITMEQLRQQKIEEITDTLLTVGGFEKVIVNAVDYFDLKVFTLAWLDAVKQGKEFLFRTAASFTKVLGGVKDQPLLTGKDLVKEIGSVGGLIVVGSHVQKTTLQLEALKTTVQPIAFIEFSHLPLVKGDGLEGEIERVVALTERELAAGKLVVVHTSRKRFDLDTSDPEQQLQFSVKISAGLVQAVNQLKLRPRFLIAKGGITSSDVGTKGLGVKKATVMGQIEKGIPVWMTGNESKFPDLPYIIFPGNVGHVDTLKIVAEKLMNRGK